MADVKKTYRLDERTVERIALYAKDRHLDNTRALESLVDAGWIQTYQTELTNPVIPVLREHLHTLEQIILTQVEAGMQLQSERLCAEMDELKELVLVALALSGALDDKSAFEAACKRVRELGDML